MWNKLCAILKKHRSIIIYLIFGVLTTAVNYLVYYPLYNITGFSAAVSNGISWLAAVFFAFLTNKLFVFHSKDWNLKVVLPELGKFVGCRLASGLAETAILYVTVDVFGYDGNVWKLITSVLVVVLNYLAGRFIVFKKKSP